MTAPRLSVLLPTRGRAQFLALALESLAAQQGADFEVLLCDAGGDDATRALAERYRERMRLSWLPRPGLTRGAARNAALAAATGEQVVALFDDHLLAPDHLARVAAVGGGLVLARQQGILTHWLTELVSVVALPRRLRALPPRLFDGAPVEGAPLFAPEDLRERFAETTDSLRTDDAVWRLLDPIVTRYPALAGFHLPWLLGLTGGWAAPRAELEAAGGFDENDRGWELEADACPRLCARGLPVTLLDGPATLLRQQRAPWPSPMPLIELLDELVYFSKRADPVDVFLLHRFLSDGEVDEANSVARERLDPALREFELSRWLPRVTAELEPLRLTTALAWWRKAGNHG